MDTPEKALVPVGAAALAAPSAAVAALKRLDAALEGQDLTDASLALYLASLHAAGRSRRRNGGCKRWAVSPRSKGRPRRRRSRAPAVGQRHPPNHPQPGGRGRHRGPGIRSQSPSWWRAIAGRRRGLDCRDADGGQVAVTGDAARGQLAARGAVARVRYGRG